jgi:hypothetical protein
VKTVRLNHLRAALLAVAAAGLLAAVGLFVVVFYAEPADANYPGKSGKIAYSGRDAPNGDYEIYTINAGGGKQPVTDNSTGDYSPDYGPGGKRIAYVNFAGPDAEIWTIQPNGGGRQQVTDNANNDRDPYWGSQ